MNKTLVRVGAGVASLGLVGSAFATDPADALAAVGTLTAGQAGYGPVLFGLAIASVAIMVGVKWIKRARGAA